MFVGSWEHFGSRLMLKYQGALLSAMTVLSAIRVIYRASRGTYGSPSLWDALTKQGLRIGEHRMARLMRQDGIRAKTVKKWHASSRITGCP